MSEISEELNQLFENLGIKNGDPLLVEEPDISFSSYKKQCDNKEDEERCNSLNSDEVDYFKELGTTPPRTKRNRKQKERSAYCSNAVAAARSFCSKNKHKIASRCASLPISSVMSPDSDIQNKRGCWFKRSTREQKRSEVVHLRYEGEYKVMLDEYPSENESTLAPFEIKSEEPLRCDSLPPMLAVKVCPKTRYRSVACKPVGNYALGVLRERDRSSSPELPADRVSFHSRISCLLQNSSQEPSPPYKSQRSDEEVLYHQEINEMIWLELQAWHAGQYRHHYDNLLVEKREKVESVYEEVMNFDFKSYISKHSSNIYTKVGDSPTVLEERSPHLNIFWAGSGNPLCSGCLSVWCEMCRKRESEALDAVFKILEKVDYVHSLFPSSKKLIQCYPSFAGEDYVARYKSLCIWFNITTRLRFVIVLLGQRLGHTNKDLIPWPIFPPVKFNEPRSPAQSDYSKDSGRYSVDDHCEGQFRASGSSSSLPSTTEQPKVKVEATPLVTFQVEPEDSTDSSNPSQSPRSAEAATTSSDPSHSAESADLAFGGTYSSVSSSQTDSFGCASMEHLSPSIPLHGLRRCSSHIFLEANPYRTYVEKLLRNKGMKKTLDNVAAVIRDVMYRTVNIIEVSHSKEGVKEPFKVDMESKLQPHPSIAFHEELIRHGKWTSRFESLGLPNIHTLSLFLMSVPLHMMMECLKIRLSQEPRLPSSMSIKQLMTEYKEGIRFAVIVRHKFVSWCAVLLLDLPSVLAINLESRKTHAIEELDSNVKKMLEVYLKWLDQLILMMHSETHIAGLQRNFLQEEWCFIQSTCPHVTDGESLAAIQFCNISCHMLSSVRDFLDTGLDDMICDLQSSTLDETIEEEVDVFDLEENEEVAELDEVTETDLSPDPCPLRKKLVLRCRSLHKLIGEARERALRAIALAKMLKMDLEVAFEAKLICEVERLFDSLKDSNHVLIKCYSLRNTLIFVPEYLKDCPEEILSILQMQMGGSSDKYLILMNFASNTEKWDGQTTTLSLSAECVIALSRVQVNDLMVIVKDGSHLQLIRSQLTDALGGSVCFEKDLIAPQVAVTQSLLDMKDEALQLCECLENSITVMEDLLSHEKFFSNADDDRRQVLHLIRNTLHQGFSFGFEYHKEVLRLVSGRQRRELAPMFIRFGRLWMKFVDSYCSVGKGCRPRWAYPGFEFLILVCDAHNTSELSDEEFRNLTKAVEDCRNHIIGSTSIKDNCTPSTPILLSKKFKSQSSSSSLIQIDSPTSDSDQYRVAALRKGQMDADRPDSQLSTVRENPMGRVREAIEMLEDRLDSQRQRENIIGRVSEYNRDLIEIKPHTVPFSWHRGFKIGSGHFGKVYTAVNNNTGEFMAMKVIPIQPNDRRSIRRVVSELAIFERINHPHLVKYYGVEIHSDEMLMFMEYCDEGTLDALAASAEGLPEEIVRKYTRQLMLAVHTLHENGIVHRDIKGANIFLAKEGNILKLGDFGCAVRLRGLQTEVNELSGIVGTHAFMAPEIFRSNEGHGRAADIWSVGCVVIEMFTGKRPWPQYDSSVQIMFQVGCGASPEVPDFLSEEGSDFIGLCFSHSPRERATSARLLDHAFVKVEEEENLSVPLFSLCSSSSGRKKRLSIGDSKEVKPSKSNVLY